MLPISHQEYHAPHRKLVSLLIVVTFLLLVFTSLKSLAAPPHGKHHGKPHRPVSASTKTFSSFTPAHRRQLTELFANQHRQDFLPTATRMAIIRQSGQSHPGVAAHLAKGKPLPPGLAKQVTFLPAGVNDYLGLGQRNVRIGVLGNDVFLYNAAQNLILDILHNII